MHRSRVSNSRRSRSPRLDLTPVTDRIVQSEQAVADTVHRVGLVPRAVTARDAVRTAPESSACAHATRIVP